MKLVAIVIPIYTLNLTQFQKNNLYNNIKILQKYDIYFIIPYNLNIIKIQDFLIKYNINILYFASYFFSSISNYNKLCFNNTLYNYFDNYQYMLLCQLDAFIFKDNLTYWCNKNYDYIGAPWCYKCKICNNISKNNVGNGGLSLRKVSKFIELTKNNIISNQAEDIYFSNHILNKPICTQAKLFSEETKQILVQNNLPFGCHAAHKQINANELLQKIQKFI